MPSIFPILPDESKAYMPPKGKVVCMTGLPIGDIDYLEIHVILMPSSEEVKCLNCFRKLSIIQEGDVLKDQMIYWLCPYCESGYS